MGPGVVSRTGGHLPEEGRHGGQHSSVGVDNLFFGHRNFQSIQRNITISSKKHYDFFREAFLISFLIEC